MSETERKALVEQLRGILPLLDGLEVGQDCADYSYAKAGGFQAMTYCPDAFEALRCVPEAIARIAALEAENARKDEALRAAKQFIENGVEGGFILMPDPDTPDTAHNTLPMIRTALEARND